MRRQRQKRKRTLQLLQHIGIVCLVVLAIVLGVTKVVHMKMQRQEESWQQENAPVKIVANAPEFEVQLLTPNPYSRPQDALEKIQGIVIHYTANPGTTAQQNRDYFEGLKDSGATSASSHFVVGIEGEIIQCIPSAEIAYASNERNSDTLSIECCHLEEDGEFTDATYDSLVHLTAWLCGKFDLTTADVIRHYDVTGKACPLYFVDHEDAWKRFRKDVDDYIQKHGIDPEKLSEEE